MPLRDGAIEFAEWLTAQGRSANTVAAYRRDVEAYLRWRRDNPETALSAYVAAVRAEKRPSSAARAVVALRIYHRWAGAGEEPIAELKGLPLADDVGGEDLDEAAVAVLGGGHDGRHHGTAS